jgi:hypothetical protein
MFTQRKRPVYQRYRRPPLRATQGRAPTVAVMRGETKAESKATRPILLSVIRIVMTPVPVDGLLPGAQLNESPTLVVLGLIPLVRAVFIGVPVVIVLVALVVVALVVLALSIFVIPIVLRAGSGHHCNRRSKGSSQKK